MSFQPYVMEKPKLLPIDANGIVLSTNPSYMKQLYTGFIERYSKQFIVPITTSNFFSKTEMQRLSEFQDQNNNDASKQELQTNIAEPSKPDIISKQISTKPVKKTKDILSNTQFAILPCGYIPDIMGSILLLLRVIITHQLKSVKHFQSNHSHTTNVLSQKHQYEQYKQIQTSVLAISPELLDNFFQDVKPYM